MLSLLFFITVFIGTIYCKVDFCEENQLPQTNPLQFTKELSVWEYAVDSKFKSLHCCARGYLSIEWFKDGRPYPWPGDLSSFIIYPESANQTVYTQTLSSSDAGNYSCRIHNDTLHMMHNTELKVFDSSGYMENPLATYSPPAISLAVVGQMARLYCEAFVGQIDLPDATTEVIWTKEGNATLDSPRFSVKKVQRENGQIVGGYLMIDNVQWSDFGNYICAISNTGDQMIVMKTQLSAWNEWSQPLCFGKPVTFFLAAFVIFFTVIFIYNLVKYYLQIESASPIWNKLFEMRRMFTCKNKTKNAGLLLIYGEGDQEFVDNTFLPLLNRQSQSFITLQKITNPGTISEDLNKARHKIEKTVVLMSHQLCNKWTKENIGRVLEEITSSNKNSSYCAVLLESFPEDPLDDYGVHLRRSQNKFILSLWDEEMASNGHQFWNFKTSFNAAHSSLRGGPSTSVVMPTTAPFRYSFIRLNKSPQPTEVPV